ncbi:DUF1465 family protein [Aurantiacibacter marinus]|uniref:Uncharacterized protein n=1 Tax=Aurantiacibacter marinus TaxID=874156 RepID=A0A0H0XVN1_9SPHN|nr:DUF1465 family protein [Aurantiacibacter marinus]KLI64325.1 hypothetical protein AAV99_01430 [Aurantiacibacter marinus]
MPAPATITPTIVDTLYEDALILADEARMVFEMAEAAPHADKRDSAGRVALSCEALRTTTRMMHAMAWLLNHRAYFAGDLSEFQLRRHGRLPPAQPNAEAHQLALIDLYTRDLIDRTKAFYARIERLDRAWRDHYAMQPAAVHRLRDRLGKIYSTG